MDTPNTPTPKPPGSLDKPLTPIKGPERVASEVLLGVARELIIIHAGREYRLRLTQNGKLILTA